ncbi:hypothetical protein O9929_08720 [Vibrio lentus]|nr:hypothetical protein [Vibrio lentus]
MFRSRSSADALKWRALLLSPEQTAWVAQLWLRISVILAAMGATPAWVFVAVNHAESMMKPWLAPSVTLFNFADYFGIQLHWW